jgi:catechol 2,3-dioxygenase-like lactoylglutathione lyase family enzyme
MIDRFSHSTIYVLDQDEAYDFYVNKLGFEVATDATMDNGFRWLTIRGKGAPDHEIALMPIMSGWGVSDEDAEALRGLIRRGVLGGGVLNTNDCQATYEALVAKGVEFISPPEEKFYGVEAILKDPFGTWFSMTQRLPFKP